MNSSQKLFTAFRQLDCIERKREHRDKTTTRDGALGAYKDDHNVLLFQQAVMSTRQHTNTVTQYDTLLAQSIVNQNDVWTSQITNPLTEERLLHPLQNDITILQIYNAQHYTTLVTDKNLYYYYDGLGHAVPQIV